MTRGGVRKGAGRPKSEGEKRTMNLCGVRVKPSRLAAYRDMAIAHAVTVATIVEMVMAVFVADVQRNEVGVAFDALYRRYHSLDLDAVFASYVTKRKGKK